MISLVGMGPGNIRYVIPLAVERLQQVDRVIAFGRIAATARLIRDDVEQVKNLPQIMDRIDQQKTTAVLASGDACFFGILDYLQRQQIPLQEVIPGITSFQYLMNRLQKSWHHAAFISLHGRDNDLAAVLKHRLTVLLTDAGTSPTDVSRQLQALGVSGRLTVGANLSYAEEIIRQVSVGETVSIDNALSVIVVEQEPAFHAIAMT